MERGWYEIEVVKPADRQGRTTFFVNWWDAEWQKKKGQIFFANLETADAHWKEWQARQRDGH